MRNILRFLFHDLHWFLFQSVIIMFFVCWNIYYPWGNDPHEGKVASWLIGGLVAYLATDLVARVLSWVRHRG